MTGELLIEEAQHRVCCGFKSLIVGLTRITLMDDKANKVMLSRSGVIPIFVDRDLN